QCRAGSEIEDARAGGNELRRKLGARIGLSRWGRLAVEVRWQLQRKIAVDEESHMLRAEVALPDPAHAGESIASTESSPRFAVNLANRKKSAPETRSSFVQDTAKADGADLAREPGRIVGL